MMLRIVDKTAINSDKDSISESFHRNQNLNDVYKEIRKTKHLDVSKISHLSSDRIISQSELKDTYHCASDNDDGETVLLTNVSDKSETSNSMDTSDSKWTNGLQDNARVFDVSSAKRTDLETIHTSSVSTITRKYFHLMMLLVYVPGLVYHKQLLFISSCAATGVLVLIEAARVSGLYPVGAMLQQYLSVFVDAQDRGSLILTPLYLILGCSLPLWIHSFLSDDQTHSVAVYAGLISVGVGDSVASIFGRKFGSHKIPGSKKSIEGTVASIVFQIASFVALLYLPFITYQHTVTVFQAILTSFVLILNACLEASTTQIDNLVVPVFALMTLLAATGS